ncbi:MAG TPA: IS4 family transposase [Candidatus Polarisedimenticolia bacterium]|nr:IS4 family transposase [Candidatus Polarisedimenticolia bacterium]
MHSCRTVRLARWDSRKSDTLHRFARSRPLYGDAEWKALVAYTTRNPVPPTQPTSLREAMRMVATLGGCLGRNGDGEPGTKSLWLSACSTSTS